jgi:hypothetical protein
MKPSMIQRMRLPTGVPDGLPLPIEYSLDGTGADLVREACRVLGIPFSTNLRALPTDASGDIRWIRNSLSLREQKIAERSQIVIRDIGDVRTTTSDEPNRAANYQTVIFGIPGYGPSLTPPSESTAFLPLQTGLYRYKWDDTGRNWFITVQKVYTGTKSIIPVQQGLA